MSQITTLTNHRSPQNQPHYFIRTHHLNRRPLCWSHQNKGSINQDCHKRFYRHMFFWFKYFFTFETSATASCGYMLLHANADRIKHVHANAITTTFVRSKLWSWNFHRFYMIRPHCPRLQARNRTQSSAGSALASGMCRDSNWSNSVDQRSQFGPLLGSVVDGKKEFSISREARFSHVLTVQDSFESLRVW